MNHYPILDDIQEVGGFHATLSCDSEPQLLESLDDFLSHVVQFLCITLHDGEPIISIKSKRWWAEKVVNSSEVVEDVEAKCFATLSPIEGAHSDVKRGVIFLHPRCTLVEQERLSRM